MAYTTWGKWDDVRVMIKKALLELDRLNGKEKEIDDFLLQTVTQQMIDESQAFVKNNLSRWQGEGKKQLTLDSYSVMIGVIVKAVKEKFEVTHDVIAPAISLANKIDAQLINSILEIGDFSFNIKMELLVNNYGADFPKSYKDLVAGVYMYDPELSKLIKQAVLDKTKKIAMSLPDEDDSRRLKAQTTFMDEIIEQKKPNIDFEKLFLDTTGKSLKDFKENVTAAECNLTMSM
ncbi:hypothetical protein [Legionella maioricensis]|uniref:Uncharacterized protein n=1 Tax=Legionella maioricensis TaxID=2896528 RepID=A0A9X2D4H7_9GAMM|nr:hypothetical protein [Legionella maioricensis]MCL9685347.1 hypothetical protein [Legionella maioricensis]MCL9688691.1 hypothetical protein [Legionella maioricensis]